MSTWTSFIAEVGNVIQRCQRSIDLVVDSAVATILGLDASILANLGRRRIVKRAIFTTGFMTVDEFAAGQHTLSEPTNLQCTFMRDDWDLRLSTFFPIGIMIVDKEVCVSASIVASDDGGRPRFTVHDDPDRTTSLQDHFERLWQVGQPVELLFGDLAHLVIPAARQMSVAVANDVSEMLLDTLRRDPTGLHQLHPRQFERVVAELLRRQGVEVQLTPQTRDGGFDIFARFRTAFGPALYLVECKKWAPDRPVDISIVRMLYGVVEQHTATGGLIVTTSRFTSDAMTAARELQYRISLADYEALQKWLRRIAPA